MGLSRMAVKRPVATATILLLILLIGAVSLYQSPLDLLPDIQPPVLAVITAFPGSSPQETLELVTRPIEEGVSAVSGLTNMNSISQEGVSIVIMQFDWGINVKDIREDVSVRMDLLNLPDDVQRPMILEFDPTLMPIMSVSASGADDTVQLTEWLEETASPRLESLLGVASVQVQGGARQDLFVRTSPDTMDEYEVSFDQIANVLRASLVDLPAGIIDLEDRQVRIRFIGRYAESEMLSDLVVGFLIDQEALEEMVGREVDINLNQVLSGQNEFLAGGFSGGITGSVPVREIYWDDYFNFDQAFFSGGSLVVPINTGWAAENEDDLESRLRIFTVNPNITFEEEKQSMEISLASLGRARLNDQNGSISLPNSETVRLEDVWIIEQAVWDRYRVIVPVDPNSLDRLEISAEDLADLVEKNALVTGSGDNYLLVSFHEDWEKMRNQPILSIPDYRTWLSDLQSNFDSSLDSASDSLEKALTELATSAVIGSMSPGGQGFGGGNFDDDFPIDPVTLEMVASIEQDIYSPESITRFNQQPSINLVFQKEGDANTVIVSRLIRDALNELSEESRGGFSQIEFDVVMDQGEEIEMALADLAWSLLGGAALAIFVLILFLRNWRTTMFIGISIPAAIIATFTLLYFADITINLMTLGGLALAAGMLVDNAIVVSENIFRRYQLGEKPADAAVKGAQEVAGAITASTLTTISVFFPVVFISGIAGQIFWEFALTVACAILASLLIALTVIPLLASRSLRLRQQGELDQTHAPHYKAYRRALHYAVRYPWWVLVFALVFVGVGVLGLTTMGTELFPSTDESAFSINATLPPGTSMSVTEQYAAEIEEILADRKEVVSFSLRVGGSRFTGMPGGGGSSNQARIRVEVDPQYSGEIERVIDGLRDDVDALSGNAEVVFARESLLDAAGLESTLDLSVSGADLDKVIEITKQAAEVLESNPMFSDIQSSLEENRPEIHIRLDQGEALQKGVTQLQVATAVRQALEGIPVSRIETDAGILSVILGYEKSDIKNISDLGSIGFYTPGGEYLQLNQVAELSEAFGPQSIPRENQNVVGQLQMDYRDTDLGTATEAALEELETLALPEGYEIKPAGSFNLMGDIMSELQLVVIMAALLVYLVMAAQFESLLHPFIIICSLPLAFTGSIAALLITGNSISIPAMIGLVVLSGILVNDGIIMVDFINQQRRIYGLPLQNAIIEGATARMRPILMTTATTVLGLLPLALGFGEGSQLQAPMAITIIGGQLSGTLLLLLAIPSIYRVLTKEKRAALEEADLHVEPLNMAAGGYIANGHTGLAYKSAEKKQELKQQKGKPLFMVVLRMLVVLIIAALILYLLGISGQEILTVIE